MILREFSSIVLLCVSLIIIIIIILITIILIIIIKIITIKTASVWVAEKIGLKKKDHRERKRT